MAWGQTGYGPGEFRGLHAIAMDASGRVFAGDRSNSRIQIFDQQGNHLATWTQFGRPSGIAFDDNGQIYVADSESDDVQNPGYEIGIRIGEVETGWVTNFLRFPWAIHVSPHQGPGRSSSRWIARVTYTEGSLGRGSSESTYGCVPRFARYAPVWAVRTLAAGSHQEDQCDPSPWLERSYVAENPLSWG